MSNPVIDRLRARIAQQQAAYEMNPTGWQPPSEDWSVGNDGRVRYVQRDPLTGAQKLFIAGTLGVAGLGAGAAVTGGLGAASAAGGSAAAGGGAGAGAGVGAGTAGTLATTVPGVTMPAIATGVPAGLPGAVSLGGLGAGGLGVAGLGGAGPEMIAPGITSTMSPASLASGGGGGLMSWLGNPKNWGNILSGAGDIGNVLGNAAQGAASGRQVDAFLNNQQDALRNQQYGTQQGAQFNLGALDLNRQQFSEGARGTRGKQAAIGNLLQNIQDVSLNVPGIAKGTISGGLRPSALGPGGRAAGSELARQAMLKLMTPDTFTGGEILTPPKLTPLPQASGWETAGGVGGLLGNILGAVGSATRPRTTATQPPPITSTVRPR